MKRRFVVAIPEVHISYREVIAETEEEAIEKADEEGEEIDTEYSRTLDSDHYTIDSVENLTAEELAELEE